MPDIIDINISPVIETVDLTIQPNLTTINVNTISGGGGAVDSVNGQIGVVVLNQDDILDGTTYKQYSLTEKNKLASIASGAEVNVNADWNAVSGDAEILNKPTIPDATSDLTNDSGFITIGDVPTPTLQEVTNAGNETTTSIKASQLVTQTNGSAKSMTLSSTNLQSEHTAEWQDKDYSGIADISDIPDTSTFVPYTGATANVDLGTHKLLAEDLDINHTSGSGVAASITKGGNGEALTVVKTSGSGNAASITGGVTLLDELHLTTDLADTYIASAATWNAKFTLPALTSGSVLFSNGSTIAQDNANLFWDDTNNRLGIGATSPQARLDVRAQGALSTDIAFRVRNSADSANLITVAGNGNFGLTGVMTVFAISSASVTNGATITLDAGYTGAARTDAIISTNSAAGTGASLNTPALNAGGSFAAVGTTSGYNVGMRAVAFNSSTLNIGFYGDSTINNSGDNIAAFARALNTTAGKKYVAGFFSNSVAATLPTISDSAALIADNSTRTTDIFIAQDNGTPVFNIKDGGSVGINNASPNASAIIDIASTTKGFLPPRMTTTQKNAIASPAAGLVVYDSTLGKLCVRTASAWETITSI